jgi:hypothetical protein
MRTILVRICFLIEERDMIFRVKEVIEFHILGQPELYNQFRKLFPFIKASSLLESMALAIPA